MSYQDRVEAGSAVGPRIYSTGPGVFAQDNIRSLEEARDVLRRYADHYNTKTIKQYMVGDRRQRQWIAMAAKEQRITPTLEGGLDFKMNLTAAMALTQVLLPLLRAAPDPAIVFTTSGVTRRAAPYWGAYAASKHAVEGLATTLAAELADGPPPMRVNTIDPGATRTRLRRQAYPAEDAGRLDPPEARTACYLWLLGPASRGLTGQRLCCR